MTPKITIKSRANNEGFSDYIVEDVLGDISGITSKAMFSGYGIYLDELIVGLIIDGTLYLKADKERIKKYEEEGCETFKYERKILARNATHSVAGGKGKKSKIITMSYMSVPIETLEDREKIKERVYEAYDISLSVKK